MNTAWRGLQLTRTLYPLLKGILAPSTEPVLKALTEIPKSPLMRGLQNGSLTKSRLATYLANDTVFLEAAHKTHLNLASKAPPKWQPFFKELADMMHREGHREKCLARFGFFIPEIKRPAPIITEYINHLETHRTSPFQVELAATSPCFLSYYVSGLAIQLQEENANLASSPKNIDPFYRHLIEICRSASFERATLGILKILSNAPVELQQPINQALIKACEFEIRLANLEDSPNIGSNPGLNPETPNQPTGKI